MKYLLPMHKRDDVMSINNWPELCYRLQQLNYSKAEDTVMKIPVQLKQSHTRNSSSI